MSYEYVIQTEGLSKQYATRQGPLHALNQLDLQVKPGEIFGYLGPNGAGKTTTIRLLLDLIRPSAGRAVMLGHDVHTESVALHHKIGFLPAELNIWKHMTGEQVITHISRLRGQPESQQHEARQLAERLKLNLKPKVRSYSTGNKRKLGLVIALMHKPQLAILDEPTSGLDPLMQQTFNELMREIRAEGRTVFLSSHVLAEVQAICDRVAILRDGQLKALETVASLTRANFHWVTLQFRDTLPATLTDAVPGISDLSISGNSARLRLNGDFDPVLRAIGPHYVTAIHVEEPSLEEIFLTFYGGDSTPADTERANS